jgi:putative NIF3 family GTP cyclohydrolase 1 type 2
MTERTLSDVLAVIDRLWPATGAEEWDTPGLVVGSADQTVSVIHLMVDVTAESVSEALESGADMIIAHHPLLLRGVTSVAESTYKGHIVSSLIRAQLCPLLSTHQRRCCSHRNVRNLGSVTRYWTLRPDCSGP